jgi:hypothetical protein
MLSNSTPQTSGPGATGKLGSKKTLLVVILVVVIVAAVVIVVATALFLGSSLSVTKKNFTPYSTPPPQSSSPTKELSVVDTNGDVSLTGWSQPYIMINGTITARGIGANTNAITFIETNSSGDIIFQAVFPPTTSFFAASYTVDINAYVPSTPNLTTVVAVTVNGNLQVSNLNAPSSAMFTVTNGKLSVSGVTTADLSLTDTNGDIDLTCNSSCGSVTATTTNGSITTTLSSLSPTGSYTLTSTNGSINLKVPMSGSFKITANITNGAVSSSGLAVQLANHVTSTIGAGTAIVTATTTNGSISVTGV